MFHGFRVEKEEKKHCIAFQMMCFGRYDHDRVQLSRSWRAEAKDQGVRGLSCFREDGLTKDRAGGHARAKQILFVFLMCPDVD